MYQSDVFSSRIRELRKSRHESQGNVADAIGVSVTQVSDMEKGRRTTTFEKLVLLCEHFNISADYLLGLTDEPRPLREESNPD